MSKQVLISEAIKAIGGYSATARLISQKKQKPITYQAVQSWERYGNIPSKYVLLVAQESGISEHLLSPEVFGNKKARLVS